MKAIPQIISGIIDALLKNLPLIIQAGVDLLVALVQNIPTIVIEIVKAIPQIITGIVSALGQGVSKIAEVGKNLIKGLWNGISNAADWVMEKIKGFGESILNGIKSFFGISSPSKVFRDVIGKNLMLGLGEGIEDYGDVAVKAMDDVADEILDAAELSPTVNADWSASSAYDAEADKAQQGKWQITQNIYAEKMTPAEVFDEAVSAQETALFMGFAPAYGG